MIRIVISIICFVAMVLCMLVLGTIKLFFDLLGLVGDEQRRKVCDLSGRKRGGENLMK